MKIMCTTLEHGLPLDCEGVSVIEIASPTLLARVMRSLIQLEEGSPPLEAFYLCTETQTLPASKHLIVVSDLFRIDLNNRKILNLLYKEIEKLVLSDPQTYQIFQERKNHLLDFFDDICLGINVDLSRSEGDCIPDFCKYINLRIAMDVPGIIEQLEGWMDIIAEWMPDQVLVLFNLSTVASREDIEALFQYAMYTKVTLLLVEPCSGTALRRYERRWVIGEDYDDTLLC